MTIKLSKPVSIFASLAATALVVAGCSSAASTSPTASSATASSAAPSPAVGSGTTAPVATSGSYITWDEYQKNPAAYAGNNVVLFFNASWCPTCQATVKSLDASKTNFPQGLTVVSVDYDTSTDLKKKYGVTQQHTFVEVNPDGTQIKKWSGTETVAAINAKV